MLKQWFIRLKRAGRWRQALRLTGERTWVRVVGFEGRFGAVVRLGRRAGIEVGIAIVVRAGGDAAGLG